MSYTYLRHNRRLSQRNAPPGEEGGIDALLDPTSHTSHTLFLTQILTNTLTTPSQPPATEEPLPYIDYNLLSHLIRLVTPKLDKHGKKRYDYLVEARRWYYVGHAKFQEAFRELQDANAYGVILAARLEELEREYRGLVDEGADADGRGRVKAELRSKMAEIEYARRANNEDLRHLLRAVRERARARDHATSWLSSLKWRFLRTEMPPLVAYAEELYAHVMGKSAAPPLVGTLPPIQHVEPYASTGEGLSGGNGGVEGEAGDGVPKVQEGGGDVERGEGLAGGGIHGLDGTSGL